MRSISVSSLPIKEAFEAFGAVANAAIIKDKFSGESRGFGFVEMPNKDEAEMDAWSKLPQVLKHGADEFPSPGLRAARRVREIEIENQEIMDEYVRSGEHRGSKIMRP
jgi:RNA recognition motif-containing protein